MPNDRRLDDQVALIIAQVSQQVRESLDGYIGQKVPSVPEQHIIASTITEQIQSISPRAEVRVDAFPDPDDKSIMNVDIYFRHPGQLSIINLKNVVVCHEVEIEGEIWTKFSIQA